MEDDVVGNVAYRVAELAPHPIFDGVDPDDLTLRKGVAGFFARGHHPPPPDLSGNVGARDLGELAVSARISR